VVILQTIGDCLARCDLPAHERWPLFEAATGLRREQAIAFPERPIRPEAAALFARMVDRRQQGWPIAYLTGSREFFGRSFWVNPSTLIPRIETELLVDTALSFIRGLPGPIRLCDLGTGSGCIGISLALEHPQTQVTVTDQSEHALQTARNNAAWLGTAARMRFHLGSWWDAFGGLPAQRFHAIVSNPPYVQSNDPHLSQGDLRFEPLSALAGLTEGQDGLADIRAILAGIDDYLEPNGLCLIEHGADQQPAVIGCFEAAGLVRITGLVDQAGQARAVLGYRSAE
jgi:release factor glutamine methyltransferase